eukprot:CAMPEP_0119265774 /NCGR_PEP_ID=MMETSP1329-20130426/4477_1 /TAXON_ID=114041 /ORGANISM="Genus nov. species nov., Strain RCC1024" /LENGTH=306 /DNA_ID=CAMNT_0007265623 /DNA_START=135 /DNA_END=1051 /DNA_ORIENTATION=-
MAALTILAMLHFATSAAPQMKRRALLGAAACVPQSAFAARGAAELDAEYYARRAFDAVRGTTPDVIEARKPRVAPVAAAARPVDTKLLASVQREGAAALAKASGGGAKEVGDAIAAREQDARKAFAARAARDLSSDDGSSDAAGIAVLALYTEASARLTTTKARAAFSRAFGDALLAATPAPKDFRAVVRGAEDLLGEWKKAGWTTALKISFEGSADVAEASEDWASGYEVKMSVALGGAASCLADACLEERGVAWHPDPCALALASYFRGAGALTAPTPHGFDEFLLDDVYRDDPRAFLPSTLLA